MFSVSVVNIKVVDSDVRNFNKNIDKLGILVFLVIMRSWFWEGGCVFVLILLDWFFVYLLWSFNEDKNFVYWVFKVCWVIRLVKNLWWYRYCFFVYVKNKKGE